MHKEATETCIIATFGQRFSAFHRLGNQFHLLWGLIIALSLLNKRVICNRWHKLPLSQPAPEHERDQGEIKILFCNSTHCGQLDETAYAVY